MSNQSINVMFVCMGNVCRSPAAHAVLVHKLRERGLDQRVRVASSGTIAYHVGEPADSRMRQELASHGIKSISRAEQFIPEDFSRYDIILAMDRTNYESLKEMAVNGNSQYLSRVRLFREFDPEGPGDVPDPYYGGRSGFSEVFRMVDRTTDSLLDHIISGALVQ
ncbi:low molecular weight protein-tyrosine-phosphatase [Marispirochaeta aestuarii]|uniref:low molecular weight protein-tyrosine-phosphatase n=1 Tax=Marispirochaeta aestuarii TaxID=1963862 RepID=UPI0029C95407|nr:low molecular weight protein-tyrosine-phosphatase [Marispirochaeta aestuarii]